MAMVTRALLHSGGLDSHMAWLLTGKPTAVYVRIGAKYEANELQALALLEAADPTFHVRLLQGPPVGKLEDPATGHIPHRNLTLLTAAATVADEVLYGVVAGEASPDKSGRFIRRAAATLSASAGRPVRVVTPLRRYTKTGALRRTLRRHPDAWDLLQLTVSCYAINAPCGSCQSCFRRAVAEYANGLRATPPAWPASSSPAALRAALRAAPVAQWPAMVRNNAEAWWVTR